ncbi:MAG: hypothetical protein LUO93_02090 [Methanomicrobiales archaeon]|nr:hypothetical protein [Methanomicrobiales archaeon]
MTFKAEDIVNWLMLALSAIGSVFWIRKRVKAGKDPASNAPEIIPPKIVQRLTGSTPIVRDDPSADFAASLEEVAPEKKSEDQLLADYRARMKRQNGPPAAPVGGPAAKDAGGGA